MPYIEDLKIIHSINRWAILPPGSTTPILTGSGLTPSDQEIWEALHIRRLQKGINPKAFLEEIISWIDTLSDSFPNPVDPLPQEAESLSPAHWAKMERDVKIAALRFAMDSVRVDITTASALKSTITFLQEEASPKQTANHLLFLRNRKQAAEEEDSTSTDTMLLSAAFEMVGQSYEPDSEWLDLIAKTISTEMTFIEKIKFHSAERISSFWGHPDAIKRLCRSAENELTAARVKAAEKIDQLAFSLLHTIYCGITQPTL